MLQTATDASEKYGIAYTAATGCLRACSSCWAFLGRDDDSHQQHNRRACAGARAAPGQLSNHLYTYQQWIRGLAAAPGLKPGPQEGTFAVLTSVTFGYFFYFFYFFP
jgi:hypothetical protein